METLLPTHPLSYKNLIKRSIVLYKASIQRILLLTSLLAFVVFIPRLLSDVVGQDILLNLPPFSIYRAWILVIDLAAFMFMIAILWRMHCIIRGVHEPYIEDFKIGLKKLWIVVLATLLQSAVVLAFVLLIYAFQMLLYTHQLLFIHNTIGLIFTILVFMGQLFLLMYISMLFYFLNPLIAIENRGVFGSLERSAFLVWNHWWRAFSVQITPWVCYVIGLGLIRFVFKINIHIYFFEHTAHSIWATVIHMIIFAFFAPWVAAVLLVQLKDLELRKHINVT